MSIGAIIGIAVAVFVVLCAIGGGVWWWYYYAEEGEDTVDNTKKVDDTTKKTDDTKKELTATGKWVNRLNYIHGIKDVKSDDKFTFLGYADSKDECMELCQKHGKDCKYLTYADSTAQFRPEIWAKTCFSSDKLYPEFINRNDGEWMHSVEVDWK